MSTIREDFEAHWTSEHERTPLTWAALFESSLQHKGQMPKDLEGVYFSKDVQHAWLAYQAAAKQERKNIQAALRHAGLTLARTENGLQVMPAITDAEAQAAAIRAQTGGEHG